MDYDGKSKNYKCEGVHHPAENEQSLPRDGQTEMRMLRSVISPLEFRVRGGNSAGHGSQAIFDLVDESLHVGHFGDCAN